MSGNAMDCIFCTMNVLSSEFSEINCECVCTLFGLGSKFKSAKFRPAFLSVYIITLTLLISQQVLTCISWIIWNENFVKWKMIVYIAHVPLCVDSGNMLCVLWSLCIEVCTSVQNSSASPKYYNVNCVHLQLDIMKQPTSNGNYVV
jgi:hypothetical protein